MNVVITVSGTGLLDQFTAYTGDVAQRVTKTTADAARLLKEDVRFAIRGAGLGKLGNAFGHNAYPSPGRPPSLHPASEVFVRGKAASARRWSGIVDAFAQGATIRSRGQQWLAIPTKECPRAARGRPMTPEQVAQRFGPLRSVAAGRVVLLIANLVSGKSRGVRPATPGRAAQGRHGEDKVMFVLVKQASIRRRFDMAALLTKWQSRYPTLIAEAVRER